RATREQRIDGGPAPARDGAVLEPDDDSAARTGEYGEMGVAWGYDNLGRQDHHTILRDQRIAPGGRPQLAYERLHERVRQALRDPDRQIDLAGHSAEQLAERVYPAGRGTDGEKMRRNLGRRAKRLYRRRRPHARALRHSAEQPDLAQQSAAIFLVELARAGLGERVGRAERERRESMLGAAYGQRGNHQNTSRRGDFDELRNGVESAHPGHVEIEDDDVGRSLDNPGKRAFRTVLRGGKLEVALGTDQAREDRADRRRIVDHQDANGIDPLAEPVANR